MASQKPSRPPSPSTPLDRRSSVSRRHVLQGLSAVVGASALGCGEDSTLFPQATGAGGNGGAGGASNSSGQGGAGGNGGASNVDACTDDGGLSPEELLAEIDTIVVLCMENRSFDHYLGSLSLLEGRDINGLTGAESNPDPNGMPVSIFNMENFSPNDPPHNWDASHSQWNMGANDGFVIAHAGSFQHEVMGYHVREQLAATYALADNFAICEAWHASVMGPTWPNRCYMHGATSNGSKGNTPVVGFKSIFNVLDDADITHRNYYSDAPWCAGGYLYTSPSGLDTLEHFFTDAAAGTLPQFSFIDPKFFGAGANDDHPDHSIQLGQALIATIYSALAQSPQWNRCLFIVTYDEHGGFYDHVAPPTTVDERPEFTQLGFRVPTLIAGPFVRKGCSVKTQLEHVSIISSLTKRFGLPSMNARVDATNTVASAINPAYLRNPQAPAELPVIDVAMSQLRRRPQRIHHPELWEAAELGLIPAYLDGRKDSEAIARRVLEYGARLGAVRLHG